MFVSENINVKTIDINGNIEAKCIKAEELKVRGSLVCDKINTQVLIVNGQINCNFIVSDSVNCFYLTIIKLIILKVNQFQ